MTPQERKALTISCPVCRASANLSCRDFVSGKLGCVEVRPHYGRLAAAIAKAGGGNG